MTPAGAKAADHAQPGDPAAARVIVDLTGEPEPPERNQVGADCFDLVVAGLREVTRYQERWRSVTPRRRLPSTS